MKTIFLLLVMVLVGVAGVAAGVFGQPYLSKAGVLGSADSDQDKEDTTSRTQDTVSALGRLEPESEIVKVSAPAGSRIERLGGKVKEGGIVKKDDPLVYLDSYDELEAAHKLAEDQLKEAKERLKAETALNQALIAAAKLKVQQAVEVLPKQIKAQEAEVRRSQAELDKCKIDLERSQKLLADRTIPQSQHDSTALLYRQCQELLDRNKATLDHLKTDRDLKVLLAQADVKAAEAGMVRAELSTLVESLTSAEKLAKVRFDRAVIKAPLDGEIIKVLTRAGEAVGRDPILKMGATNSMYAIAEVYETDIRNLRPGMKATVTSRAFPEDKLTGVVERIGTLVFKNDVLNLDPAKDADTRVIEVRIRLDDSKLAARYNYMQVDVSIHRDGQDSPNPLNRTLVADAPMKTPLAWNNVTYNKVRTAASLAGVIFSITLIFMQLGFYDVCFRSSTLIYDQMDFDIALVSPQYVQLRAPNVIPRRRLDQAKRIPGVARVMPLYVANGLFRNPQSRNQREIVVLGVDPGSRLFKVPELKENLTRLNKEDTAIMDAVTGKGYDKVVPGLITEVEDHRTEIVGTYRYGSGFTTDASMVVSDKTLSKMLNGYPLDLVSMGLVKLAPGADLNAVVERLEKVFPSDVKVWKRSQLETSEQHFYVTLRPLGVMFRFGVLLAFAVGAVILYQILSSEIMNKLKEYATLKAMGYSNLYMNKVVLQQATFFSLLGFFPATLMALGIYRVTGAATNLPMVMTWTRVIFVLVLTIAMCSVSGLLVSRKVARADPADLF